MTSNSMNQLLDMLNDKRDWRVRNEAITELAKLKSPKALDTILSALYDESPHVVRHACDLLTQFGPNALPGLLEALYSPKDVASRQSIIFALDDFHDPDLIPHFIHFLKSSDAGLIHAAAVALEGNPDTRALAPLLAALKQPNAPKATIVKAVSKLGDANIANELYPMLFEDDYEATSRFTAIALGKYKTQQTLEMLLDASRHDAAIVRSSAAEGLGIDNSDAAYNRLLEMLGDTENWVRDSVVMALGKTKRPESVPVLLSLLNADEPNLVSSLRVALGDTGDLRVIFPLLDLFRNDYDHDGRGLSGLAETYWQHRKLKTEVFPKILLAMQSEDIRLRICALWVFHDISFKYAESSQKEYINFQVQHLEHFIKLLSDGEANIRLAALVSLSHEAVQRVEDLIINCLNDHDLLIAEMAANALGCVNSTASIEALIKTTQVEESKLRDQAILSLMRLGNEKAVEPLIKLLEHKDSRARSLAAHTLGNFKNKQSVQALLTHLHTETDEGVKSSIVWSLGRLGDQEVVSEIISMLEHEDEGIFSSSPFDAALFALGSLKSEQALSALYKIVNEGSSWQRRMQAVEAIGEVGTEREIADRMFELLGHEHDTVRTTASKRLGYLGAQSKDLDLRDYIVNNLIERLQDRGVGYHYSPTVAHMAARSLYFVGTTKAIEALKNWELKSE